MGFDCDVLLLGTGAAGTALAARLATSAVTGRSVVLVDTCAEPLAGRAWAYWSDRHTVLDGVVEHTWDRLAVIAGGRRVELHPAPYRYRLLRGEPLQALADRLLGAYPGSVTRLTGPVHQVDDTPDAATVHVAGVTVRARWVLDSRPPPPPRAGEVRLRFLGHEVIAPDARFDPGCATFMDFRVHTTGEVRFCYLLPTAPDRALVEIAAFGAGPGTRHDLADRLDTYLHRTCGLDSWQVLRHEAGDLALGGPGPRRAGHRILRVGTAGGMLKPSTGYAFDRIVRDADAVVTSLDRHGHPWALPRRHPRHTWLDRVLLRLIIDHPEAVEPAFARMFARNPVQRVLRFLDEDTRPGQELALLATLPPGPFLRAALHRPGRR